ncbi:hypothetical protein [Halorubrum trueperi]|uniref:MarR family transcriptional regulator n=1 Tax=Halorubrum trueperi TaxID=2004704 RepID=A0ABD5UEA3_9EURY
MEDPDWAKILNYLYKENSEIHLSTSEEYDVSDEIEHPSIEEVPEKTGLNLGEIRDILNKMSTMGIVDCEPGHIEISGTKTRHLIYTLNKEGFNVAHDREQKKSSQEINLSLVILTWILAGAASIQAVTAIVSLQGFDQKFMTVFSVVLLLVVYIGIQQTAN